MELNESQVSRLRQAFRALNKNMLLMWRLGLRRMMASPRMGYLMVMATTGRKSGERRLVPLNFAEEGTSVYCLAGFGKRTHWLLNLEADPQCELWLPDGRRVYGHGKVVTDETTRIEMVRRILVRSGFAAKIAEHGLDPMTAPEEVVAELGQSYGQRYEVVQIEIGNPASGPGGPGDLVWVWPIGIGVLAAFWLVLRKQ